MSNRLESLNSKKPASGTGSTSSTPGKGPGAKPKFKPKVVVRKSKEERAKVAPTLKTEPTTRKPVSNRGRGGARGGRGGGRGGRNYAGTHILSNGFLSAGAVSIGNSNGSKLGLTNDLIYGGENGGSEFISGLKLKEEKIRNDSDDEGSGSSSEGSGNDGRQRINMTKEYRFREEDVVLFPVRPFRDDGIKRKEPIYNQQQQQVEQSNEEIKLKTEPGLEDSATPMPISLTQSRESTVKSENIDEKLEMIKESKSKLESKIVQGDPYAIEESNKLITDYQQILDIVTGKLDKLLSVPTTIKHKVKKEKTADDIEVDNEDGEADNDDDDEFVEEEEIIEPDENYVLFQLPKHLPSYNRAPTLVKLEKGVKPVDEPYNAEEISQLATHTSALRGQIGKINIHQSGKITIDLGDKNIRLNATKGASTDFLQELAMIEMMEQKDKEKEKEKPEGSNDIEADEDIQMVDDEGRSIKGKLVRLGTISEKIVATPSIQ
ncbi:DNA-directed RNA polymerase III subunit RPC4 [Candida tropicalis]